MGTPVHLLEDRTVDRSGQRDSGQIVILNGAPRSGKSSIVAIIQETFDDVWINLGVDRYMAMTPQKFLPGIGLRPGGERPDLEPLIVRMYLALYESIAAHSRLGLNVVADVGHHDAYSETRGILPRCAAILRGLAVLFVGVRCPVEVILERRRDTGWQAGRAEAWERAVHEPGIYDLEVDTSQLSPEGCAEGIRRRLESGPPPNSLARLAGLRPASPSAGPE